MSMRKGTKVITTKTIWDEKRVHRLIAPRCVPKGTRGVVVDVIRHPEHVEYDVKFLSDRFVWMCTKDEIVRSNPL